MVAPERLASPRAGARCTRIGYRQSGTTYRQPRVADRKYTPGGAKTVVGGLLLLYRCALPVFVLYVFFCKPYCGDPADEGKKAAFPAEAEGLHAMGGRGVGGQHRLAALAQGRQYRADLLDIFSFVGQARH